MFTAGFLVIAERLEITKLGEGCLCEGTLLNYQQLPGFYKSTSLPPYPSVAVLYLSAHLRNSSLRLAVPLWLTESPNIPKGPRTLT